MPRRGASSQRSRCSSQERQQSASQESTSQESSSQQSRVPPLSDSELTTHSSHAVRYILSVHGRSRLIRIEDIRKHALPNISVKNVKAVMSRVADQLDSVFGLKLTELSKKGEFVLTNQLPAARPASAADDVSSGSSSCRSILSHVHVQSAERQRRALIMVVLAAIYMNHGMMTEASMWSFLQTLQLLEDDAHPCFGDAKKFVSVDMVRQRYVKITTPPTSVAADGDQLASAREITWGDHATAVLKPLDVLQFVCEVWGDDVEPSMWTSQYRRATQSTTDDAT